MRQTDKVAISGMKRGRETSRIEGPGKHEIDLGFALDFPVDSDDETLTSPPAAKRSSTESRSDTSSLQSSKSAEKSASFRSLSIFTEISAPAVSQSKDTTPSSLSRTPKALDDLTAMARALSVVNSEGSDNELEEEYGYPIIERSQSTSVIGPSTFQRASLFEPLGIVSRSHSVSDGALKKSALSL